MADFSRDTHLMAGSRHLPSRNCTYTYTQTRDAYVRDKHSGTCHSACGRNSEWTAQSRYRIWRSISASLLSWRLPLYTSCPLFLFFLSHCLFLYLLFRHSFLSVFLYLTILAPFFKTLLIICTYIYFFFPYFFLIFFSFGAVLFSFNLLSVYSSCFTFVGFLFLSSPVLYFHVLPFVLLFFTFSSLIFSFFSLSLIPILFHYFLLPSFFTCCNEF